MIEDKNLEGLVKWYKHMFYLSTIRELKNTQSIKINTISGGVEIRDTLFSAEF